MSEELCPICKKDWWTSDCRHTFTQLGEEYDALREQLSRNELVIKGHIAREEHLQEKLEVAKETMKQLKMRFLVQRDSGAITMLDDALAKIERIGGENG